MKADLTRNTFHPSEAVADSAKPEWRETVDGESKPSPRARG